MAPRRSALIAVALALLCAASAAAQMHIVPHLSAVILVATIATLLLAVFSYAVFKLRNSRSPKAENETPVFFHRFRLEEESKDAPEDEA